MALVSVFSFLLTQVTTVCVALPWLGCPPPPRPRPPPPAHPLPTPQTKAESPSLWSQICYIPTPYSEQRVASGRLHRASQRHAHPCTPGRLAHPDAHCHIDDPGPELPLTDLTALAALLSPCYPVSTTMVPVVWTTASARALHQMPVTVLHN